MEVQSTTYPHKQLDGLFESGYRLFRLLDCPNVFQPILSVPISFFDFTYRMARSLAIWIQIFFLGRGDPENHEEKEIFVPVESVVLSRAAVPSSTPVTRFFKKGPTRIMKHYDDVILRYMDVCISLYRHG